MAKIAGCSEKHVWTFSSPPIIWRMANWLHQLELWHSWRIQGLLSLFSEQCAKFLQSKFIHRWVSGLPITPTFQLILPIRDVSFTVKNSFVRKVSSETKHCKVNDAGEWMLRGIPTPLNQSPPNCQQTMPFYFTTWAHSEYSWFCLVFCSSRGQPPGLDWL